MVEEQEIVRVARARSAELIASAEAKSRELRKVASDYVEDIMRQSESSISSALATIQTAHRSFQSFNAPASVPASNGEEKNREKE